ncbi:MAG: hypothetical protein C5B58_07415 [Acidobacteria bacterium]|nr:MAG: hypothetical protein C5B58_07415 [Acidobacteriota bacterium]
MTESVQKRIDRLNKALGYGDQGKIYCEIFRAAMAPNHPKCAEARAWFDHARGYKANWELDAQLC